MTTPPTQRQRPAGRLRRAIGLAVAPTLLVSGAMMMASPTVAQADPGQPVPDTAALAGELADQQLSWETCDFGNDAYNERFNLPNVQCATVQVPQDWHDPDNGETWDIRISQAKNVDVDDDAYKGTIFVNPGGPGGEGLVWGPAMQEMTPDLRPYYNYVGFDPRGVGQSSHAECTYSWDTESTDPYAELKAAAAACSADEDVRTISTEQTTYDMDFIRHLLGAPKLSYIGYSYGTWLGAWYEKVFGAEYGGKFLLDSSIDATDSTLEETWNLQPIARDRQFEMHLMNWIARHDSQYGLGTDPAAIHERYLAATGTRDSFTIMVMWILTGAYGAFPNNADYPLAADVVQVLIELGESDEAAPEESNPAVAAEALLRRAVAASDGETKAVFEQARKQVAPLTEVPTKQQSGNAPAAIETATLDSVFDFVRCNDGQWTQGEKYWERKNAELAEKAPLSDSWGLLTVPICAYWQTDTQMPKAHKKTFPATVVVQGEMDSQTGWEGGHRSGTKLPNTSLIAVDNEGSHGLFPYGVAAVDQPILSYFLDGRRPRPTAVVDARPLPTETTTFETWRVIGPRARHVGPVVTDPTTPADAPRGGRTMSTAGATTGLRDLVAEQASEAMLRNQVQRVYGEQGVKAIERAGLV